MSIDIPKQNSFQNRLQDCILLFVFLKYGYNVWIITEYKRLGRKGKGRRMEQKKRTEKEKQKIIHWASQPFF